MSFAKGLRHQDPVPAGSLLLAKKDHSADGSSDLWDSFGVLDIHGPKSNLASFGTQRILSSNLGGAVCADY